jgi:hypothetical protein
VKTRRARPSRRPRPGREISTHTSAPGAAIVEQRDPEVGSNTAITEQCPRNRERYTREAEDLGDTLWPATKRMSGSGLH